VILTHRKIGKALAFLRNSKNVRWSASQNPRSKLPLFKKANPREFKGDDGVRFRQGLSEFFIPIRSALFLEEDIQNKTAGTKAVEAQECLGPDLPGNRRTSQSLNRGLIQSHKSQG
jgi:hypothetical protein